MENIGPRPGTGPVEHRTTGDGTKVMPPTGAGKQVSGRRSGASIAAGTVLLVLFLVVAVSPLRHAVGRLLGGTSSASNVAAPSPVRAGTPSAPIVTSNADSGLGSLRDAIGYAAPDAVIAFRPNLQPIVLTSGELVIDKNLTIAGPSARAQTISGGGTSRVFRFESGTNATLSNLTVQAGHTPPGVNGGGIQNAGTLVIANCSIVGNSAGSGATTVGTSGEVVSVDGGGGGGIANARGARLTAYNVTISGNAAGAGIAGSSGGAGGGIVNAGVAHLFDSTVSQNTAGSGGSAAAGTPGITSPATGGGGGSGGGIANLAGATLELRASTIMSNTAGRGGTGAAAATGSAGGRAGFGGGLDNVRGVASILDSTVAGNNAGQGGDGGPAGPGGAGGTGGAGGRGGGLDNADSGQLSVTSSTITDNAAGLGGQGGTGVNFGGSSGMDGRGGGLENAYARTRLVVANSIVAANTVPANGHGLDCFGRAIVSLGYNLVESGGSCHGFSAAGDEAGKGVDVAKAITPLGPAGGSTDTLPPERGSSLNLARVPISRCGSSTDQRGVPRPQGPRCDVGAVEAVRPILTAPRSAAQGAAITLSVSGVALGRPQALFLSTDCDGSGQFSGPQTSTALHCLIGNQNPQRIRVAVTLADGSVVATGDTTVSVILLPATAMPSMTPTPSPTQTSAVQAKPGSTSTQVAAAPAPVPTLSRRPPDATATRTPAH